MRTKIAMLMPYFGKWPKWINLYLYSCSRNNFIDFYFLTDCERPKIIYPNTKFITTSWEEYCRHISDTLGFEFKHKSAYKLCDVRPFYGKIHKDIIKGYDFWGWGDLDVCYGDLSNFYTEKDLKKFDVLSAHADRMSGHFMLVRNNDYFVEEVPFKLNNWKERLIDDYVFGVDEHDYTFLIYNRVIWIHRLFRHVGKPLGIKYYSFFNILTPIFTLNSRMLMRELKTSEIPKNGEEWHYDLSTGKVYKHNNEELPYLHYLFFKKTPFYQTEDYWREDFWQIQEMDYSKTNGKIIFDNHHVSFKPQNR